MSRVLITNPVSIDASPDPFPAAAGTPADSPFSKSIGSAMVLAFVREQQAQRYRRWAVQGGGKSRPGDPSLTLPRRSSARWLGVGRRWLPLHTCSAKAFARVACTAVSSAIFAAAAMAAPSADAPPAVESGSPVGPPIEGWGDPELREPKEPGWTWFGMGFEQRTRDLEGAGDPDPVNRREGRGRSGP